jgi:voltage-gated potassium channel Kch
MKKNKSKLYSYLSKQLSDFQPKYVLQVFIFISINWTAVEAPLTFAFNLETSLWQLYLDGVISILFLVDTIIHIKDALKSKALKKKNQPKYLKSIWFPIDLLCIIPFDLISASLGGVAGIQLLRLIRLFRILRIIKIISLVGDLAILPRNLKIAGIIFWVSTLFHWIACGWMVIYPDLTGDNITAYSKAIYWTSTTLTTIGYGDIVPTTNGGRFYTIFVMITGVGFYGVVIGNVSKIFLRADKQREDLKEKIEGITTLMTYFQIPRPVKKEVYNYYNYLLTKKYTESDFELLATLPPPLQMEIKSYMNIQLISGFSLFKNCSKECLKEIARNLNQTHFAPNQKIITKGDTGKEMYILSHGKVAILGKDNQVLTILQDGEIFGEMALVKEGIRNADVMAKTYCEVFILSKDLFTKVVEKYPNLEKNILGEMKKRLKNVA